MPAFFARYMRRSLASSVYFRLMNPFAEQLSLDLHCRLMGLALKILDPKSCPQAQKETFRPEGPSQ